MANKSKKVVFNFNNSSEGFPFSLDVSEIESEEKNASDDVLTLSNQFSDITIDGSISLNTSSENEIEGKSASEKSCRVSIPIERITSATMLKILTKYPPKNGLNCGPFIDVNATTSTKSAKTAAKKIA